MISLDAINRWKERETPFYHYDLKLLSTTVSSAQREANRYGYHLHYALKANAETRILEVMLNNGLGADCVSGAEVARALQLGFNPNAIAFAGVGKSDAEIELAISSAIFTLNVESLEELKVIESIAQRMGKTASIALRLNPDVDAQTHRYITTGLEENKFGISAWQLNEVMDFIKQAKCIQLRGLHFHIGSQIRSLVPFKNLCTRIDELNHLFLDAGFNIDHINAGGGLGIDYDQPDAHDNPDFNAFFGLFNRHLALRPGQALHFELGRSLVANCGDLISRVLYVKRGLKTKFLILDAGMTELIRPALYQAVHRIENLTSMAVQHEKYDVVGPVCESSDCFGKAIALPLCERGDLIAIRSAGAYGESMASHYNLRSLKASDYTIE